MEWDHVLTIFVIVATNLGTVIALYINTDKKIDEQRKETNDILKVIHQEMKDFHGKLERQDAEFKAHLLYSKDVK